MLWVGVWPINMQMGGNDEDSRCLGPNGRARYLSTWCGFRCFRMRAIGLAVYRQGKRSGLQIRSVANCSDGSLEFSQL